MIKEKVEKGKMPEKMEAVCKAVIRLKAKGQDIFAIKVSDIAKEAGIGKGTIYDYFKTKEDIFIKALMYEYCMGIAKLEESIFSEETFQGKVYSAFGWIAEAEKQKSAVIRLVQSRGEILEKGKEFCSFSEEGIPAKDTIFRLSDHIFEQGVEEGLIRPPKSLLERDMVIGSIVGGWLAYLHYPERYENKIEEVKEISYRNLQKLLERE